MFASKAGETKMDTSTMIAGIDAAKKKLDIAVPATKQTWTVENDRASWQSLGKRLRGLGVTCLQTTRA